MSTATLTRTPAMLTVTLPRGATTDEIERAMDWVNENAALGAEGTFIDLGDLKCWTFPAAA